MDMIGAERPFHAPAFEGIEEPPAPRSMEQILACSDRSFLVIDDGLRILHANAGAVAALGCPDDERRFDPYVVGDAPSHSTDMRRKIRSAVVNCGRAIVALNHPRHRRLICSVKGVTPRGSSARRGVVALTPENHPAADVRRYLCDVYKLSRTEAEIAVSASMGAEAPQIMLEREVAIDTLRAQMASIKAKMGLSRMTEVAVAVARIQAAALI